MKSYECTACEYIYNPEEGDPNNGTVKVQLVGECTGCAMSQYMLKIGVDRLLMKEVREVKVVELV